MLNQKASQSDRFQATAMSEVVMDAVRERLPNPKEMARVISELLHLSTSAVYRKMSGEVPLTLNEAAYLLRYFQISMDNLLFGGSDATGFRYRALVKPTKSSIEFYQDCMTSLRQVTHRGSENVIFFATTEITPFHYMYFPELTAMQVLIWSRMTARWPEVEQDQFTVESLANHPEILMVSKEILDFYSHTPSTEFISSSILDSNLDGLLHFAGQSVFEHRETPLLICDQLEKSVRHLMSTAKSGKKFPLGQSAEAYPHGAALTLFHDPIASYNVNILAKSTQTAAAFTTFDSPNFLFSTSPNTTNYMERWFDKIKTHCHRISSEGEMHRTKLLHVLLKKVDMVRQQLKIQLP